MKVRDWIRAHPGRIATVRADAPLRDVADAMLADPALRDVYVQSADGALLPSAPPGMACPRP